MNRKNSELVLKSLETSVVIVTLYTLNPPVGIVVTPLAIYCLIGLYKD